MASGSTANNEETDEVEIISVNRLSKQNWLGRYNALFGSHPNRLHESNCRRVDTKELKQEQVTEPPTNNNTPKILKHGSKHVWNLDVECLTCASWIRIEATHLAPRPIDKESDLDTVATTTCPKCQVRLGLSYDLVPPEAVLYAFWRVRTLSTTHKKLEELVHGLGDVTNALESVKDSIDEAATNDVAEEISGLARMVGTFSDKLLTHLSPAPVPAPAPHSTSASSAEGIQTDSIQDSIPPPVPARRRPAKKRKRHF